MSNNIEWLIGEYRSQKDKVIGLQCDVAALVRKNDRLSNALAELVGAATLYVASSEGESELDPFITKARGVL